MGARRVSAGGGERERRLRGAADLELGDGECFERRLGVHCHCGEGGWVSGVSGRAHGASAGGRGECVGSTSCGVEVDPQNDGRSGGRIFFCHFPFFFASLLIQA